MSVSNRDRFCSNPVPWSGDGHAHPQYLGPYGVQGLDVGVTRPESWSGARDLNPGPHGPEPRLRRVRLSLSVALEDLRSAGRDGPRSRPWSSGPAVRLEEQL